MTDGAANRAEEWTQLARSLLRWYRRHRRDLPWRRTRDPYRIWVAEIMLQQTRVTTVLPYYERFLERFPGVKALAAAPEPAVLEAWSGLGYYRRVHQMRAAAQEIARQWGGAFPSRFDQLRKLPGIGDYTAAAISSMAFGERQAVLDGNVARVLTRLFDEERSIGKAAVWKHLRQRAQSLLEAAGPRSAAAFNQAMMELGATVCAARSPQCLICPAAAHCLSRKRATQEHRPVRAPKKPPEKLDLAVAVVQRRGRILMRQRPPGEKVMPGFWELPSSEGRELRDDCLEPLGIRRGEKAGEFRHGITFRSYSGVVYGGEIKGRAPRGYRFIRPTELRNLPVTTITRKALKVWEDGKIARRPRNLTVAGAESKL